MMVAVRVGELPVARPETAIAEAAHGGQLLLPLHRQALHRAGVGAVGGHAHARGYLVVERMVLHGAQDDRLERGRDDHHGVPRLGVGAHGGIRLEPEQRRDALVVELGEEGVHLGGGLALERREHEAAHGRLVLRQAQLVGGRPQKDAEDDSLLQHLATQKVADQQHGRVARDAGAVEVEHGKARLAFRRALHLR